MKVAFLSNSTHNYFINASKKKSLAKAGWKVGSIDELLGLSAEESAIIEMRLSLASGIKQRRMLLGITEAQLAKRLGSSQSRVV